MGSVLDLFLAPGVRSDIRIAIATVHILSMMVDAHHTDYGNVSFNDAWARCMSQES